LAEQVRTEHPLLAVARPFFQESGFEIQALEDGLACLVQPTGNEWKQHFESPVYARFFPDRELDREAVIQLAAKAQSVAARDPKTLFALIDQPPSDSGWISIGGLRAEGVQVVPIDDAFMQQARVQQQERRLLQAHLRKFLGRQRDLYNVRDPVGAWPKWMNCWRCWAKAIRWR